MVQGDRVYRIGRGFGGFGVNTLAVIEPMNAKPLLAYAFGWGSGIHRSQIAVFDCQSKEPREYLAPQSYFSATNEDLTVGSADGRSVEVRLEGNKVGRLIVEGKEGARAIRVELEKTLPGEIRKRFANP